MGESGRIGSESAAVQTHLTIMQAVIERMSSNSTSCKAWCITLVSAILVIVADKGRPNYALLPLIPTILFLVLDAYYLALERGFRESYNSFIEKLNKGEVEATDLFYITPKGRLLKKIGCALLSFAIWPFYTMLGVMVLLAKVLVIG